MDKNTHEATGSAGSDIDGYLGQLFSTKGVDDKQLEMQIAQLLKSTLPSLGCLNPNLIKSVIREVFLGATSYNGSISKSRRILDQAKSYFQCISHPCSSDAELFHCIAFYVQAESKEKDIAKGVKNILEHREALIAFPEPQRESVIAGACDGLTFGDKRTALKFLDTINLNRDLLKELPIEVSEAILSQATDYLGIDYKEAYPTLHYKGEKLRATRRYQAEVESRLGVSRLSLSQIDSLFSESDRQPQLEIDDLPRIFSFVASRKADLSSISPGLRQACAEQAICFFRLNGYKAPGFLGKLFVFTRRFPRHRRRLEDVYQSIESLYTLSKDSDQIDCLLQCFLDRQYLFSLPKTIFDEVLVDFEGTFKGIHQELWPEPNQVLTRTLEIMDHDTKFLCSLTGKNSGDAFSKLISLSILKGDDLDGIKEAKLIIDFVKDKRLCPLRKSIANCFILSACNLTAVFGGDAVELLPILLKIYTKTREELVKDISNEDILALKNAALMSEDQYLLNLARKLEREEQPDHLRIIDENIDDSL